MNMAEQHRIDSREEWLKARLELWAAEKAFTRQRDALTKRRMAMPWERVEKPYRFEGPNGYLSLADLFDGCSQLIVYHFMFGPDWDEGCKSRSFMADNFNSIPIHLNHRDVTLAAVSRAPFAKIAAYKKRMGWTFPWVSSHESDFNFDYHVSFTADEIAKGAAQYNFASWRPDVSDESESASSRRTKVARCSTPILVTRVEPRCSMVPITTSIWYPKVATRMAWTSPRRGCVGTISIKAFARWEMRQLISDARSMS